MQRSLVGRRKELLVYDLHNTGVKNLWFFFSILHLSRARGFRYRSVSENLAGDNRLLQNDYISGRVECVNDFQFDICC